MSNSKGHGVHNLQCLATVSSMFSFPKKILSGTCSTGYGSPWSSAINKGPTHLNVVKCNRNISETPLPITKTKNGDHFNKSNYPPKCGKTLTFPNPDQCGCKVESETKSLIFIDFSPPGGRDPCPPPKHASAPDSEVQRMKS